MLFRAKGAKTGQKGPFAETEGVGSYIFLSADIID